MRSRRSLVFGLALVTITAFVLFALRPKEPSYKGKTLNEWLQSPDPILAEAVRAMRPACIPTVIKTIKARPTVLSRSFESATAKLGWRVWRETKLHRMQKRAPDVFALLGTNGLSAVDELAEILEKPPPDSNAQNIAACCLATMGEIGVTRLVHAFQNPSGSAQTAAALGCYYTCGRIDLFESQDAIVSLAVPSLLSCVTNSNFPAAVISLRTLAELNAKIPGSFVPSLTASLTDANMATKPIVLEHTLRTIGQFGRRAAESSNVVAGFTNHPDPSISGEATKTLRRLRENP